MPKLMTITLERRGVSCVAELLEKDAPRTCEAVWNSLPLGGDAYHAKYARNEVYTMVERFSEDEVGLENPTITPIPGDVVYFSFAGGMLDRKFRGEEHPRAARRHRPRHLLRPQQPAAQRRDVGWVPGNVYATIVDGLDRMAEACNDVWRSGGVGERLVYSRAES